MKTKSFLSHLKNHSTTILFLAGFVFDMVLLPDAEHVLTRYIGLLYLVTVALSIMIREWVVSRNTASKAEQKLYSFFSFAIAYFSGSALSFVLVYAIRSADISVSWPLFIILFLCILANELISAHNLRLTLDVAVLFIAMLFFIIFNAPLLLHVQNDGVFGVSVAVSIVISLIYIVFLRKSSEVAEHEAPRSVALAVGIPMFVGMLYFLNAIPAVPLSLKHADVYHLIQKDEAGNYQALGDKLSYFDTLRGLIRPRTYTMYPGDDAVYFYSAVNAPALLTAPLSHMWEYYDEQTKQWIVATTISFGLTGGRDDGYRAYSKKENVTEGLWRVTIMVDTKRVVGRRTFVIKKSQEEGALIRSTL